MPLTAHVDPDTGIAHYSAAGHMDRDEVISVISKMYRDPSFQSPWHSMWDLTGAKPSFTADDLRDVAAYVRANRPVDAGRIAIVATEDLVFGMGRMFEVFASDLQAETRVFRELEQARRWLLEDQTETS